MTDNNNSLYSLNTTNMLQPAANSLPYSNEFYQQFPKTSQLDDINENDLTILLKDSNGVQIFTKYLENEERAAHYLSFWFGCNGFKKNPDPTKIYDIIKVIYRTFIRSESKTAVALQPNTKKNIVDKISSKSGLDKTIFDDALIEVWNVLLRELYPRFVKSSYYQKYINNEKIPNTELSEQKFIQDLAKTTSSEMPYVEYVMTSSSLTNQNPSESMMNQSQMSSQPKCQVTSYPIGATASTTNNNNGNIATNQAGKERRGIAETDPQSFYEQLCHKLEKLRFMQTRGRSLLNTNSLMESLDDDPQKILDIHDSFVMKKDPHKLETSTGVLRKDADLRSVVSQDSGVATNYDQQQLFHGIPHHQHQPLNPYAHQMYQQQQPWQSNSYNIPHNYSAQPNYQINNQIPFYHNNNTMTTIATPSQHHKSSNSQHYQPNNNNTNSSNSQNNYHNNSHQHQYQHHYRHDHHHHLKSSSRRRNRSEDQSICSLEENTSQKIPYIPRKGKSQASDASSIFDSGVSSTYEQISHSWMISTDRVSHWIINQPMLNTPAEPAIMTTNPSTSYYGNQPDYNPIGTTNNNNNASGSNSVGVMRRSYSAQQQQLVNKDTTTNTTSATPSSEVWIDTCNPSSTSATVPSKNPPSRKMSLLPQSNSNSNLTTHNQSFSSPTSSTTANSNTSATNNPATIQSKTGSNGSGGSNSNQGYLIVGYYLCGDPVPYRTMVPKPSLSQPFTLGHFKQLLPRRGPYRFFFKRACDEFEGSGGAVQEEYSQDDQVLPLWEGKIVAKVEKVD